MISSPLNPPKGDFWVGAYLSERHFVIPTDSSFRYATFGMTLYSVFSGRRLRRRPHLPPIRLSVIPNAVRNPLQNGTSSLRAVRQRTARQSRNQIKYHSILI